MAMLKGIFVSLMACAAHGAALRAAVSKVDITPATGEVMWGFETRTTPAKGALDPLYARVLVLESGDREARAGHAGFGAELRTDRYR